MSELTTEQRLALAVRGEVARLIGAAARERAQELKASISVDSPCEEWFAALAALQNAAEALEAAMAASQDVLAHWQRTREPSLHEWIGVSADDFGHAVRAEFDKLQIVARRA